MGRLLNIGSLARKVREKGIYETVRALWRRIVNSALVLRPFLIWENISDIIGDSRYPMKKQPNLLYAFYDLAVAPATFDFTKFLMLAELERKKIGCSSMHVVFVPGPDRGFQSGELEIYRREGAVDWDVDSLHWRLRNILVPCSWLLPSCCEVTVCASRQEARVLQSLAKYIFPPSYTVRSSRMDYRKSSDHMCYAPLNHPLRKYRFPKSIYDMRYLVAAASNGAVLPTIEARPQGRRFVNDWIRMKAGGRKVITITLRECAYNRPRTSSVNEWAGFARSLDTAIYCPVFIRDTDVVFNSSPPELDGLLVFPEASWNLELLVALYELSYLNMFVSSGRATFCWFIRKARSITFMLSRHKAFDAWWQFRMNLKPGTQYKCLGSFHRMVWEDDRLENIQKAFKEMCDGLERKKAVNLKWETPLTAI